MVKSGSNASQAFELQQAQTAWQQQMVNLQQQQQAQEKQWEEQQQINGDMNPCVIG